MKKINIASLALCAFIAMGTLAGCTSSSGYDGTSEGSSGASTAGATSETTVLSPITAETSAVVASESGVSPVIPESPDVVVIESAPVVEPAIDENLVLDAELQEYANTFITNFVEQYFQDYERDYDNIEQRLDFVHIYLKINSSNSVGYEQKGDLSYETFSTSKAQSIIIRYFGAALSDEDCKALNAPPSTYGDQPAGPFYEDGKIWYQAGAGEGYNQIGIVNGIYNNGNGNLTLDFTIYSIDMETFWDLSSSDLKAYYRLTPYEADNNSTLTKGRSGRAVVGVAQSGDYYLISYDT